MDTTEAKITVLNWLPSATWQEKQSFIQSVLDSLQIPEVKTVANMCNKTKRFSRMLPMTRPVGWVEPVPVESVPPPNLENALVPGWWNTQGKQYTKADIVAFDCEHVHYHKLQGENRIKAANVAIYKYTTKFELDYYAEIRHEYGCFMVNKDTRSINGFEKGSFIKGEPLEQVQAEVKKKFTNKLVVTHSGGIDFKSLKLNAGDFDHFDIASYFRRPLQNKYGENIGEKISLRNLCMHYFKKDIQADVHSVKMDALATLRIFLKVYIPLNENNLDRFHTDFEQFENIPKCKDIAL